MLVQTTVKETKKAINFKTIANKDLKTSIFSLSKLCKLCANDENKIIQSYIDSKHKDSHFKSSQITTKLVTKLATYKELNKVDKNGLFIAKKELFSFWFILSIIDRHIKATK